MALGIVTTKDALEQTGIRRSLLEDLSLKTLCVQGEMSLCELAEQMRVDLGIVEELFHRLRKEQLYEVRGMVGGIHVVTLTSEGKARALEALSTNQYVGPAPVSLADYVRRVRGHSIRNMAISRSQVEAAFRHMVLSSETIRQIGTAVVSGTSIFLHGPSGTGKTAVAETLPTMYEDSVLVPYAVEVDGQIVTVYDASVHKPVPGQVPEEDARWVRCRRPRVLVGGEMTMEMLDLQLNPLTNFYSAPLQMKANNGVLIIDDFGRQRVRPEELLNRWIVPLDRGIDFLTLSGGQKFEIPFDPFVVFSTNLDLKMLADEAFLRRINNKIKMDFVNRKQFHEIFRGVCEKHGLPYHPGVVDELLDILTQTLQEPLRPCYPRDIVQQIGWTARFEGREPKLDRFSVAQACRSYFLTSGVS